VSRSDRIALALPIIFTAAVLVAVIISHIAG